MIRSKFKKAWLQPVEDVNDFNIYLRPASVDGRVSQVHVVVEVEGPTEATISLRSIGFVISSYSCKLRLLAEMRTNFASPSRF